MLRPINEQDRLEIQSWLDKRKLETKMKPSSIGAIEPGVAAAFLYITDGNFCLIDYFVSNPDASPQERDRAILAIIDSLESLAKELGFDIVLGLTGHQTLISRGIAKGYRVMNDHVVLAKEIK